MILSVCIQGVVGRNLCMDVALISSVEDYRCDVSTVQVKLSKWHWIVFILKSSIIEWVFSGSSSRWWWCSLCFCPSWSAWGLYCQGGRTENGKLAWAVSWESSNFHSGMVVVWLKRVLFCFHALFRVPSVSCNPLFILLIFENGIETNAQLC